MSSAIISAMILSVILDRFSSPGIHLFPNIRIYSMGDSTVHYLCYRAGAPDEHLLTTTKHNMISNIMGCSSIMRYNIKILALDFISHFLRSITIANFHQRLKVSTVLKSELSWLSNNVLNVNPR